MSGTHSFPCTGVLIAAMGMVAIAGPATAQDKKMRMSEAQCESAWNKANPNHKAKITLDEARPFLTDMKAVNKDNDATIERPEFMRACAQGHVRSSAVPDDSSGESGTSPSPGTKRHNNERGYDKTK